MGNTIYDASELRGLHTCSTKKYKTGTGSHILDRASLENPRAKKIDANILRQ